MNIPKVAEHIIGWLSDYIEQTGIKGMVIGISGGIDSAVVSALCARTGKPVLCLEMPLHQAPNQVSRGKRHIEFLKERYSNVKSLEVELTSVFEEFVAQIPPIQGNDLALANTRSRLRMTTLYYFAGLYGYMVVGTGNKIEDFGVGFFTKYGDGGVDVSPIADLMKSEVYKLAEYLDILDEDQLGASYDELEWAMKFSENKSEEDGLSLREKQVLSIFRRLNRINQHKMNPIPICKIPKEYINN